MTFSEFIRLATPEEKEKVYSQVMKEVTKLMEDTILKGHSNLQPRGFIVNDNM